MLVLTAVIFVIATTASGLLMFVKKLDGNYRFVFFTSGLLLLGAILFAYLPTDSTLLRIGSQIASFLWFIATIGMFTLAIIYQRKKAKAKR